VTCWGGVCARSERTPPLQGGAAHTRDEANQLPRDQPSQLHSSSSRHTSWECGSCYILQASVLLDGCACSDPGTRSHCKSPTPHLRPVGLLDGTLVLPLVLVGSLLVGTAPLFVLVGAHPSEIRLAGALDVVCCCCCARLALRVCLMEKHPFCGAQAI